MKNKEKPMFGFYTMFVIMLVVVLCGHLNQSQRHTQELLHKNDLEINKLKDKNIDLERKLRELHCG